MSLSQTILTDFDTEAENIKTLLEAVPEEKFDWKPHDKPMSLGQLAEHVAETPSWVGAADVRLDRGRADVLRERGT